MNEDFFGDLDDELRPQVSKLFNEQMAARYVAEKMLELEAGDEGYRLLDSADIYKQPPKEWIIQDRLPYAPMLVYTYGAPESGKSLVTLRDLHAISHGIDTSFGFKVNKRIPVVYVDTEGSWDFQERMKALELATSVPFEPGWFRVICEQPVVMASRANRKKLVRAIRDVFPEGPVITVFDTQAGVTEGVNENSAQDMSGVIANFIAVAQEFKAPVWVIHHSGKSDSDLRGSSAMRGRARMVTHVDDGVVACDKLNGAAKHQPFKFEVKEVGCGVVACLKGKGDPAEITERLKAANAVWDIILRTEELGESVTYSELRKIVRDSKPGVSNQKQEIIIKRFLEEGALISVPGTRADRQGRRKAVDFIHPQPIAYKEWVDSGSFDIEQLSI